MKQPSLGKAALAVSVFACATMLSFDWSEQKGVWLSVERAQAQVGDPYARPRALPGGRRGGPRPMRAAVGAGAVAAGSDRRLLRWRWPLPYYGGDGGGGPYGYYSGPGAWSQDYAARNGHHLPAGTLVRLTTA